MLRSDVPAELDRLIMRSLAKEPGARPTMPEVENELANILDEMTARAASAA